MDVGVGQACKAAEIARHLSDTALFLLIESVSFPKSDDQRAFPAANFRGITIRKRVDGGERAIGRAIDALIERRLLNPLGQDMVHATQSGNLVRHAFRTLRNAQTLHGVDPSEVRSVAYVAKLRGEMNRLCKQRDAQH
jgi:hypothetical protein